MKYTDLEIKRAEYTANSDNTVEYHWLYQEFLDFVRKAPSDSVAVENIKLILKEYEHRKTYIERLKNLFDL